MNLPCEKLVKQLLPTFRAMIAKELITKHGFSQVRAAEKLGITQAAISQYIYEKRGGKQIDETPHSNAVKREVEALALGIAKGEVDRDGISIKMCQLCNLARG